MSQAPPAAVAPDEAASVEHAVAALEAQRSVLGDAVVDAALGPLRKRLAELRSGSEERRLVTVVFADLVDFTAMSERLDPEDVRAVVDRYFARWLRIVTAHGGVVEKFIGDAVMAVFGLQTSFEDDAHRAVRASLALLADLPALNHELEAEHGVRLQARVGVDTGQVVVSTLGDRDGAGFVAVGPTVNRASRLQGAAPVGGVLVSAQTHRLIKGAFALDARFDLRLKGVAEPVDAYVVRRELSSGFRLERATPVEGVVTTTIGRAWQLQYLQQRLEEVEDERALRVVTVLGDAGIGKTRLLLDLDAWLLERPEAVWWFRGRASPTTSRTVGALLRDMLSARLGIRLDDGREQVRERFADGFEAALGPVDGPPAARLVAVWLGYEPAAEGVPTDPQAVRDGGTAALARYFAALAERSPVVVLLEDLHWADEETLRWIDAVAPLLQGAPVLVVASARPALLESRPHWGEGLEHHLRLDLPPLTRRESRDLVRQLLSRVDQPPATLIRLLLEAGEGNPFYLEELVGWLVDVGVIAKDEPRWRVAGERVGELAVPPTLRGVLQSRLDALGGPERGTLQRASVIGRVFWDAAVDHLDASAPSRSLDSLREREVVLQREVSRFSGAREFVFKHALLRDVAYDAVLRRNRERYHRATAGWLTETAERAGRSEEYAAVIAEHLERARDPIAAGWYLRAAARAAAVYALEEASTLLDGADRTAAADDTTTRFDAALAREALLDRTGDRTAQERVLDLVDDLAAEVDEGRRVLGLLARARWSFLHSDYGPSLTAAVEAERLAVEMDRQDLLAEALMVQGKARTWLDEVEAATALLDRATRAAARGDRPAVVAESRRYLSMLAGNTGDYPAALEHVAEARRMFAAIGDAEMEAMALAQSGTTLYRMGDFAAAQEALEETIPIFRRAGHRYREVQAMSNLAAVAVQRGNHATAIRVSQETAEAQEELGDVEATAVSWITLGVAHLLTGSADRSDAAYERALAAARTTGNRNLESAALIGQAQLALLTDDVQRALRLARGATAAADEGVSALERGQSRLLLGYALLQAGRAQDAEEAARTAVAEFVDLGVAPLEREARALAAACGAARGDSDGAVPELVPLLDHLTAAALPGTLAPGLMLLQTHDVLARAGDERAADVRAAAGDYVRTMAAEVGDPELEAGYLSLPSHAALLAL